MSSFGENCHRWVFVRVPVAALGRRSSWLFEYRRGRLPEVVEWCQAERRRTLGEGSDHAGRRSLSDAWRLWALRMGSDLMQRTERRLGMPHRCWTIEELRGDLVTFERKLVEEGKSPATVHTYVDRADRFINWLAHEYSPGERRRK